MIRIATYFRLDNGDFTPISQFKGTFPDIDNIEGAIELNINGKHILTLELWDYIDVLWAYLVNGLVDIINGKDFVTYFPDQPIILKFSPDSYKKHVTISVNYNNQQASVGYQEFMDAMIQEADRFFNSMVEILPNGNIIYNDPLQKVENLKAIKNTRN